ncbi:MAG: helix-turn-helix domain-containing protein [Pseudonocardiaceae bacterium]
MAPRRQGLSQRRKAVGLTQESLAERLGVERSTVVRWEAGDTEPLPSMRPNLARVLQVSIDQLAELLTESETTDAARAPSADAEVTIPMLLPEVQSKVRPGRVDLEDLIPQVAGTVEALRRALRPTGVIPEDRHAVLLAQTEVPHRPSPTAIPLGVEPADVQRRRTRSRRFNRFAAAGALALAFAGGAASMPLITSHSSPSAPAAGGTPKPNPGSSSSNNFRSNDTTAAGSSAPVAAPIKPADGPATPGTAAVLAPQANRSDNRTTSRSKPRGSTTTPARPRTPAIPAEAAAWSHKAALSANDQRITRLAPPRP